MKKALTAVAIVAVGLLAGCTGRYGASIEFTASTEEGATPLAVQFTPVCDQTIVSYAWAFGDGGTSNDPSPIHVYRAAGTYTVSLTVELLDGYVVHRVRTDLITVSLAASMAALDYIYWIHVGTGSIWRGPRGGGNKEEVPLEGTFGISALDVVGGWIYWADSSYGGVIRRARPDGSDQETLITGQRFVTDICVVPEAGTVFWVREPDYYGCDDDASGGVYMAFLSDLTPLRIAWYAPGADQFSRHVDVDVLGERIYWTVTHLSLIHI